MILTGKRPRRRAPHEHFRRIHTPGCLVDLIVCECGATLWSDASAVEKARWEQDHSDCLPKPKEARV